MYPAYQLPVRVSRNLLERNMHFRALVHALLGLEGEEAGNVCSTRTRTHLCIASFLFLPAFRMYSSAGTTSGYYTIYAQGRETNTRTPSAIRRGLFRRPILLARSKTLNLKLLSQRQAAAPSVVALHFSREAGWVFKQYPKFLTHRIVNEYQ